VLLAVFADIHANRQAFSACLDLARARGAERTILLGDFVGYGADPEWTLETVMELVDGGALAVRGNHDSAIGIPTETMNAEAQAAIEWTRGRLSAAQRRFLADLPLTLQEDDRLYVHSEASNPSRWRYVQNTSDAGRSILATSAHATFLRPHPSAGALFDVVDRQDDELLPDVWRPGEIAEWQAMARRSRLGGAAARRRCGGLIRDVRHRHKGNHLLPRAL
jgi:diadenosine tetraphosphatase ApaH/serine/threonine PP2A family protein phosphatase